MATHLVWLVGNRFDNSVCVCVYVYHLTMRKPHMLTTDMIEIIQAYPLGLVASIRPNGRPAVSPKGTFFLIRPEQIACAHIRAPKTVRNIQQNSHVEVNFVDILSRIAVRIEGLMSIYCAGRCRKNYHHGVSGCLGRFCATTGLSSLILSGHLKTPSYDLMFN